MDFAKSADTRSETIWLSVINEIFKFSPHFDLFCQVNYFYEFSVSYPNGPTQKWHIWASFQTSRKRFRTLQEPIWLTVINGIFKFWPHFNHFGYINYLYELSPGYPNYSTQKWNIWASFQTSRKRFRKLQETIWLIVIDEIFKFSPHIYPFGQVNYLYMNSLWATRIIKLKMILLG